MRETDCAASLVCSVEKHQVPGFRGGEHGGHGFRIAHFAHQDHVRRLPQDAAQRVDEVRRIVSDFDLLDDGAAVDVLVFDGIFDGDDVRAAARVDQVDHGGERGAFAAAGGAGDQHQALAAFGDAREGGGQMQRFERGNARGQQADAGRQRAALMMDVGAEAAHRIAHEAEIHRFFFCSSSYWRESSSGSTKLRTSSGESGGPAAGASAPFTRRATGVPAISRRSEAFWRPAKASS